MNKHTAVLLAASALTAAPLALAPVVAAPAASADVCASAGGRHFSAGGCTNIAGDVATGAAIAAQHVPYVPGEVPCYTVEGVPYFTPPGEPC
ncbi:MAG: hypothetical protein WBB05_04355 [Mycolicibacterium fortuitum]|uniref:hypothetical protein n=1 Tax=Mycolicibacterium fortuitum TaxID=1766 RepID=UPI0007F008FA|nr:hypothetical protein [Mycolicibacterium fortuitum]OBK64308.1 hypothetical protein A5654_22285 [Mycolicibacterium fortuitum]